MRGTESAEGAEELQQRWHGGLGLTLEENFPCSHLLVFPAGKSSLASSQGSCGVTVTMIKMTLRGTKTPSLLAHTRH